MLLVSDDNSMLACVCISDLLRVGWREHFGPVKTSRVKDCLSKGYVDMEGPLQGHTASIRTVVADPIRSRAVSCGDDGTARIWDLGLRLHQSSSRSGGGCLGVLEVPGSVRESLACFACGRGSVVTRDGSLLLYDLERLQRLACLEGTASALFAVQLGGPAAAAQAAASVDPDALAEWREIAADLAVPTRRAQHSLARPEGAFSGGLGWCRSAW